MRRWLLGAATIWPLVYIVFFFIIVAGATIAGSGDPDGELLISRSLLFTLHLTTMALIVVLLTIYVRHAYRNPDLTGDRRTFWAVVLLLGGPIAMPVYWWQYIRPGASAARVEPADGRSPS